MRLKTLTYEEAKAAHPDEVAAILQDLRKSRSKSKSARPEDLTWTYECCVRVPGYSFSDLLSGKAQADSQNWHAATPEEQAADEQVRTMTGLHATCGRWFGSKSIPNPPEVYTQALARYQTMANERKWFEALLQQEQQDELQGLLKGLKGGVLVQVPVKKV